MPVESVREFITMTYERINERCLTDCTITKNEIETNLENSSVSTSFLLIASKDCAGSRRLIWTKVTDCQADSLFSGRIVGRTRFRREFDFGPCFRVDFTRTIFSTTLHFVFDVLRFLLDFIDANSVGRFSNSQQQRKHFTVDRFSSGSTEVVLEFSQRKNFQSDLFRFSSRSREKMVERPDQLAVLRFVRFKIRPENSSTGRKRQRKSNSDLEFVFLRSSHFNCVFSSRILFFLEKSRRKTNFHHSLRRFLSLLCRRYATINSDFCAVRGDFEFGEKTRNFRSKNAFSLGAVAVSKTLEKYARLEINLPSIPNIFVVFLSEFVFP